MIAKVITGKSFGGCVRYLLERKRSAVLDSAGVRDYDIKAIIADLNAQRKLRHELGNAVGHTVLSWSNEDRDKLTIQKMAAHAREYMEKMGIGNTQYVTVLHTDKQHPHVHIVYNRVDNDGNAIGNFNHWHKSRKICREMTERHGYHLGKGKEQVNRQALRGNDRLRYYIHDALKSVMAKASSWKQVEIMLAKQGIGVHYKYRSGTDEVQGISFEKDGVKFRGSAIDRRFSFAGLEKQLNANAQYEQKQTYRMSGHYHAREKRLGQQVSEALENSITQTTSTVTSTVGSILNELMRVEVVTPEPDPIEEAERRRRKRLKQQAKGRSTGMSR